MKSIKERREKQIKNINPDIKKHYTPIENVELCLSYLNLKNKSVLDVGSGDNMIWYNNLDCKEKDWVEIDKGKDLFDYNKKVDWCVGNPPYRILWEVIDKCLDITNEGIAFLVAIDGINRLTPKRLQYLKNKGFYLNKIIIQNVKLWWGRYFFIILTKKDKGFVSWKESLKLTQKTGEKE